MIAKVWRIVRCEKWERKKWLKWALCITFTELYFTHEILVISQLFIKQWGPEITNGYLVGFDTVATAAEIFFRLNKLINLTKRKSCHERRKSCTQATVRTRTITDFNDLWGTTRLKKKTRNKTTNLNQLSINPHWLIAINAYKELTVTSLDAQTKL